MANDDDKKINWKQYAGKGFENMEAQDFSAPFLVILQALSPQLQEQNPQYIPDAKAGRILNTQSNLLYKEVHVIPVRFSFRYVEWKSRGSGGGFVASYNRSELPNDIIQDKLTGQTTRANGNVIQQTAYYLAIMQEENWSRVIIPMTSTQLKKARLWNSQMQSRQKEENGETITMPMFGNIYRLSPVAESNNKGTWYGWKIEFSGEVKDLQLMNQAAEVSQIENFLPERLIASMAPSNGNGDKDPF